MSNPKDKRMHPDDKRNMVIFFIACIALFFIYDRFISQPQMEAIKKSQEQALSVDPTVNSTVADKVVTRQEAATNGRRVQINSENLKGSLNMLSIIYLWWQKI